jgi:hypothetical protein
VAVYGGDGFRRLAEAVMKVAIAVAKWVMEALTSLMAEMAVNDGGGYYDAGDDWCQGGRLQRRLPRRMQWL